MRLHKPPWLKSKIPSGERYFKLHSQLTKKNLSTICQAAKCPNISECWNNNHATFLILGDTCTRNCGFCSVRNGVPNDINPAEADHIAEMIKLMGVKYAVITSVTRDDQKDGGSGHFYKIIKNLRLIHPNLKIEVLIPDFNGNDSALNRVLSARPDVLGHNLETVRSLYQEVNRNPDNYLKSLKILKLSSQKGFITKSGLMVGLGETKKELLKLFEDLRESGVTLLTIGQYLQPTKLNYPVKRYYTPEEFSKLKEMALEKGFIAVESGPFVRSSYHADQMYEKRSQVLN